MNQPARPPILSIIIVTWNRWADTERCLESIAASSFHDYELVVIDNASADGTPERVAALVPDARITRNVTNTGHSRAVNQGIKEAHGEFIMVLDADTEVAPDTLRLLVDYLRRNEDVGIVAPRTYNSDGSVQETARAFPRPLNGLFGRQSLLTRWFPDNPHAARYLGSGNLARDEPFDVEQVSGACMVFPRWLPECVGLWDEGYFAYWVDTDWCYQVGKHGHRIVCVPAVSIVHHEQNQAGKRRSVHRIWHFHYGAYRFYRNNMTLGRFDPRAIFAMLALAAHAVWQWLNNFRVPPDATKAEASREPTDA